MALLIMTITAPAAAANKPKHHTADGFRNLYVERPTRSFLSYWRMRLFGRDEFADQAKDAHKVPVATKRIDLTRPETGPRPRLTWLGQATFLIEHNGFRILTDPHLSYRASPLPFAGPKRLTPLVYGVKDIGRIDYVIISHNHYDHLDGETIDQLGSGPTYLVPLKLKPWFVARGIAPDKVIEFDWWHRRSLSDKTNAPFVVTATPSQHWSSRSPFDRYKTLWAAWHLDFGDFTAWFAGDTGYSARLFREIGAKMGPVDLAMIPIGAYAPRWFMKTSHVTPEEAVLLHKDIKARLSIAMHWGTFQMTAEPMMEPVERFKAAVAANGLKRSFVLFKLGETRLLEPEQQR
jgi:N-acyl-phosphatidylethanolamine-hydrolysing phospholipase D